MTFRILSPQFLAQIIGDDLLAIDLTRLAMTRAGVNKLAAFAFRGEGGAVSIQVAGGDIAAAAKDAGGRKGVAIIPVQGVLMPKGGADWFGAWQGMDSMRVQLEAAANHPDVAAIILDVDSPGGAVTGTMETAAAVREAASKKKVVAVVDSLAASAAYWIASQASKIVATPSADVGSIGVYSVHNDYSAMLRNAGIGTTIVKSSGSPYKAEGNPYEPLSDEAKAYAQSRVDESHGNFVRDVAQGRGATQTAVRDTYGQGRVVDARKGVSLGMVDEVGDMNSVLTSLLGVKQAKAFRKRAALL